MSEQAVASDANEAENQTSEETSAPDELDQLLSEYDQETKSEQPQPEVKPEQVNEVVGWVQQQRQQQEKQEFEADVKSAVDSIRESTEDLDVPLSDKVIKGFLFAQAEEDPKIGEAFQKRKENPKAWNAALNRAKKALREEFSVDQRATQDREAVAAAVRGANQKQPEPDEGPDVSAMSDQEFAQYKMKLRRQG